ncbi:related to YBT1-Vacuolar, ABC protein transporting bile acids [Sporisorium reilianum SRZ2]|uniref:Related to YBT1-Vacuolar, ABC protein transporting bile acids n=1 Tax=Sporisorium reilianum (strain SRZ2) TaxID=999809 RepID=E7A1U7_SPORE|nr:related to YBT1-Vacuolar, ABC protein transporting bile acids [Sporisorium reilianum SRZ2]
MIPSISPWLGLHRAPTLPTATSLPSVRLPLWDQYTVAALALASTILVVLLYLLFTSPSASPQAYTLLHNHGAETPDSISTHDDDDDVKHEVNGYPFELRKALGTPIDAAAYESHRLALHIVIALLSVVGLTIDAASIVANLVLHSAPDQPLQTTLYFAATCAALRTLTVSLAMLHLNLHEQSRLMFISLLSSFYLVSQLLVFLTDYKLSLPGLGGDSNLVLHAINLASSLVIFLLAFLSPSGPVVRVQAIGSLPARNVGRNAIGGGSVAQNLLGFLAFPLVHQAHSKNRIEEDDIPAIDYTYRSAVVAEEMIRNYRRSLAASLAKVPAGPKRTDGVKARALLSALAKCNARQLIETSIMLVIVTFAFYVPKLGLAVLLDGIEKYEASLRQSTQSTSAAVDTVSKRARSTLIYSAIFYLTLFVENFLVYHYFRPLSVYLKTKMQTQLTTLLAWKRLRQKEASAKEQDTNHDDNDTHAANADSKPDDKVQDGQAEASVSSSSQVINLVTTDATRIFGRVDMYVFGIMGPLEVIIGGYSAYALMGKGALIGLAAAAIMQPIAFVVGKITKTIDEKLQKARDRRVMLLSEAIRAIRMVKYEAWEDEIGDKIMLERRAELKCQAQSWVVYTFFGGLFTFVPMLTIVVAFTWYTLVEGNTLTASVAFPAVAVLNELRFAVSYLPSNFLTVIQAWVSMKRIAVYMEIGEVDVSEDDYTPQTMSGARDAAAARASASTGVGRIELRQAEITWPSESDGASAFKPSTVAQAQPSSTSTFTLSIPDATFELGHINLVCGKIGSGKTLLLLSLLGEAQLVSGKLECPRSHPAASLYAARTASASSSASHRREWWIDLSLSAYAPQRPFLFNATVRENILFGLEFNARRYRDVIFACGLKPDLKVFKDGDRTEIGEGGTNLSGGQKARISLARAVYSHAGTVLIDDCLSALDSHTTKHVCETLFGADKGGSGLLDGRTTILVTHHVRMMAPRCKKVLVLQEGRQAFFGSAEQFTNSIFYEGLEDEDAKQQDQGEAETPNFGSTTSTAANSAANSDEEDAVEADDALLDVPSADVAAGKHAIASAFSQHTVDGSAPKQGVRRQPSNSAFSHISGLNDGEAAAAVEEEAHKQVTEEGRAQGRVSFAVYSGYIRAGGGVLLWIALVGAFAGYAFSDLGANWWLRIWTQQAATDKEHSTEWWLARWIVIQSLQVVAMTLGYALICIASLLAGSRLFKQLLRTVLRAPLRFHDSTPSGRLLNRFGKDMEAIDSNIAEELTEAAKALLIALAAMVATFLGGGPIVLVILSFMAPVFYVIVSTFTLAARDLKRLDSNSASKRITCFTDLITGVVTVRAFGSSSAYFATLMEKLDENMMFYFWQGTVRQWQSLLLSLVSSVIVISTVLVVTLTPGFTAARAGFTLGFVQNLTSMLTYGMRSLSNVEQGLVAVERVMEYFGIETEPLDAPPASVEEQVAVPASWPEKGAIEIKDLHLAYAENLPDVLDGINLSIRAGERVGIVGATGSGKSTLVSALFRFFEYRSGQIEIDGVDVSKIGLKTLRSRMKIVPQDPLILSGMLRSAVDPLGAHADEDITRVLVRVGLLKEKPLVATGYGTFDSANGGGVVNATREGGSTSSSTLLTRSPPTPPEDATDDSGTLSSLEARIEESGSNLSSGQKQLLSLSRILLSAASPHANANSIVVLDESTSSIDYTTNAKIQSLLDAHFARHNTTVLAIAHRLRTIIGFDTVVVLNRGKVVEKGSPRELLAMEDGWFTRLAKSTGEQEHASLKRALGL